MSFKNFSVLIKDRNDIALMLPNSVNVQVLSYSDHAQLGHFDAYLRVTGNYKDVFNCINWLKYAVEIENPLLGNVWNGFVYAVSIRTGSFSYEVSLDTMYNSISVLYTNENDEAIQTEYTEDDVSVSVYGSKQLLLSMDNTSEEAVNSTINRVLTDTRFPIAKITPGSNNSNDVEVILECRGYLELLQWNYYERNYGLIENTSQSNGTVKCGVSFSANYTYFEEDGSYLSDIEGKHISIDKDDQINVSGTTSNNGNYTVSLGTNRESYTYSTEAGTITFSNETIGEESFGVITDSTHQLDQFSKHNFIYITGTTSNDGYYLVDGSSSDGNTLQITGTFTDETPAGSIAIQTGNYIQITGALTDEQSNATVTVFGKQIGQHFTPVDDFDIKFLVVQGRKQGPGGPTQPLRLSVYSDNAGVPDTELGYVEINSGNVSRSNGEIVGELSSLVSVTSGTFYWLIVSTTNADFENYYEISVDEQQTYAGGVMKLGDGNGNWVTRTTNADLIFKVIAGEENATQLDVLVDNTEGLSNAFLENTTGLKTAPYRDGSFLAYDEFLSLLNQGTSNERRLLSKTDNFKTVFIYEEPAKPSENNEEYYVTVDGIFTNNLGEPLPRGKLITGNWVGLLDVLPSSTVASYITHSNIIFVEFMEYDIENNVTRFQNKVEQEIFNTRG